MCTNQLVLDIPTSGYAVKVFYFILFFRDTSEFPVLDRNVPEEIGLSFLIELGRARTL